MRSLTVLICTHDRVDLLRKTLASLNAAERPQGWQVDLLVIANACTDATHQFLDEYRAKTGGRIPLRWHPDSVAGKSHALNSAMPLLESEVVAFVDDDHRVDRGYVAAVCRAIETCPEADIFCGRILPDWDGSEPSWIHDTGPYRIYPLPVPRYDPGDDPRDIHDSGPLPGGGNLFLRTPWLARVGDFSTEFGPKGHNLGGAEDLEWIRRAIAQGARLRYVPDVIQHHYVDQKRLRLAYLMQKAFERSASSIRLRRRVEKVPLFTYRKAAGYLTLGLFSLSWPRTRFYLVRFAAALGEIKGYHRVASEMAVRHR